MVHEVVACDYSHLTALLNYVRLSVHGCGHVSYDTYESARYNQLC
jgi:hypothetical protein